MFLNYKFTKKNIFKVSAISIVMVWFFLLVLYIHWLFALRYSLQLMSTDLFLKFAYQDYMTYYNTFDLDTSTDRHGDYKLLEEARINAMLDIEDIFDDTKDIKWFLFDTSLRDVIVDDLDEKRIILNTSAKELNNIWVYELNVENTLTDSWFLIEIPVKNLIWNKMSEHLTAQKYIERDMKERYDWYTNNIDQTITSFRRKHLYIAYSLFRKQYDEIIDWFLEDVWL